MSIFVYNIKYTFMGKWMWTGSDVLYATSYPPSKKIKYIYMFCYRIFIRIVDFFCESHYVVSEHLIDELKPLKLKKKIKILSDPPLYLKRYNKIRHDGINVLYYMANGTNIPFKKWVYGYDIFIKLKNEFPNINFIEVNGNDDMTKIYPVIDFYIRPNRHDGCPRMIMECDINDIPYYHSLSNPDIEEIKKQLNEISLQKTQDTVR